MNKKLIISGLVWKLSFFAAVSALGQSVSPTPTFTFTPTPTFTGGVTFIPSQGTATFSRTFTPTLTGSNTRTATTTPTKTFTFISSQGTAIRTNTPTGTPTHTPTPTGGTAIPWTLTWTPTQVNSDPLTVTGYGCFAQSGDGGDILPSGQVASIIPDGSLPWTAPAPCGLHWIADNPGGLAPNPPPSVITFNRTFVLPANFIANGQFTLSFKADDAAEFYLNGQSVAVASCTPPVGNDGECQQYCHVFNIPASVFVPGINTLQSKLTNLFNVQVGNNTGWTSLSYSLCVAPLNGTVTVTQVPSQVTFTPTYTFTPTPTGTWTPTNTPTSTPTSTFTWTPTPGIDPTPIFDPTTVPTLPVCGPVSLYLTSLSAQNLVYSDPNAPGLDGSGKDWTQAAYSANGLWMGPQVVTAPPPEWNMTCGPAWISSVASGLPASPDVYYRLTFTLPSATTVSLASLSFAVDDGMDVWVNGVNAGSFPGSLTTPDPTRNYHVCNSLSIPGGLFQSGTNVLAFHVQNLMTYEGLNYSFWLWGSACGTVNPTPISSVGTAVNTSTPTSTLTWTPTPVFTAPITFTPVIDPTPVATTPITVTGYGCFAQSGDGGDILPNGQVASIIPDGSLPWTAPAPCGLHWIADNPGGLASNPPPSAITFNRTFVLPASLIANGQFTLSFKADDAAQFFLNGQSVAVASCTPPVGNDGECQQYCHVFNIPGSAFVPGINTLQSKLTNLFNVQVGNNTGWTSLSYSLCLAPVTAVGSPTPVATVPVTATSTWTPTNTPTPTPLSHSTITPTPDRDRDHEGEGYPNPCQGDHMRFHYGFGPYEKIHIKIYSLGFRLLCHNEHICSGSENEEVDWDLKDDKGERISNGIYYVRSECLVHGQVHRCLKKVMIIR